jgi:hypothetical protein
MYSITSRKYDSSPLASDILLLASSLSNCLSVSNSALLAFSESCESYSSALSNFFWASVTAFSAAVYPSVLTVSAASDALAYSSSDES